MNWGEIELEPEVEKWFLGLSRQHRGTAAFYVDLLAKQGVLLGEPYTRQLSGKLRELRFHLDSEATRITYWIASGRRIILLTAFRKQRMRESGEVERALRAMRVCMAEEHTADEE
ncbi:type II toxin-antitoxin system RelE/ParE family toxin [Streptomyces kurssanovii]|uniref:Type II toxin-antitoxin system RelE/ParE family toxin n=1 Tax=Streptomyces kurssanovii TaxID=67312 RepID=A0ABV3I203_9ACTN